VGERDERLVPTTTATAANTGAPFIIPFSTLFYFFFFFFFLFRFLFLRAVVVAAAACSTAATLTVARTQQHSNRTVLPTAGLFLSPAGREKAKFHLYAPRIVRDCVSLIVLLMH